MVVVWAIKDTSTLLVGVNIVLATTIVVEVIRAIALVWVVGVGAATLAIVGAALVVVVGELVREAVVAGVAGVVPLA